MIRAVLFDYDGVLVDSMPYHVAAWMEVMSRYDVAISPEEIYLEEGSRTEEVAAELFKRRERDFTAELLQEIVEAKRDQYLANNQTKLVDGALDLVQHLKKNGYRLGLVTGSIRAQVEGTLGEEIRNQFDCMIASEDVEHGKPNPEPFLKAAQRLNVAADECLVVENAPLGVHAARAAGMWVVAVLATLPAHYLREAHQLVADLIELRQRLPQVLAVPDHVPQYLHKTEHRVDVITDNELEYE
jgi:beta-phosphoglucomutase